MGYVYDVYNQLKLEGERFPAIDPAYTSSVLLETLTPPKWAESDVCFRCRNRFTTANRRHHCRQCGQSFCDPCSSKRLPLPHFGFQDPQRVCDSCSNKVSSGNVVPSEVDSGSLGISDQSIDAARKEQEELERAIALSLKEEEAKRSRKPSFESSSSRRPAPTNNVNDQEDEDLKRAIEVSLKEMKLSSNDSSMYGRTEMNSGAASSYSSVPAYTPVASYTPATVSASLQVNDQHVSSMELENIKMFVELVERLERDGANGHVLGNPQIQVSFLFLFYKRVGMNSMKSKTVSLHFPRHYTPSCQRWHPSFIERSRIQLPNIGYFTIFMKNYHPRLNNMTRCCNNVSPPYLQLHRYPCIQHHLLRRSTDTVAIKLHTPRPIRL